jgi:hypothetical protein
MQTQSRQAAAAALLVPSSFTGRVYVYRTRSCNHVERAHPPHEQQFASEVRRYCKVWYLLTQRCREQTTLCPTCKSADTTVPQKYHNYGTNNRDGQRPSIPAVAVVH